MKSISYHVIPLDINSLRDRYTRTHTNTHKQMHITHTNIQVHSHVHKHTHTSRLPDYKNQTCTSQIATARQSVRKTDNYLMCALALTLKTVIYRFKAPVLAKPDQLQIIHVVKFT